MPDPALKLAIGSGRVVLAPGVYDMMSALLADRLGFAALYVSGYGVSVSHLGLPDAGLLTYRDMVERVRTICERTTTPVVADADTGFGGLLNVHHTVRGYEAAGVSAIQIEDQEFPKKCGHTLGRRVIAMEDMVAKVRVAVDARASDDFLIIARTDSRTALGLDEALRRALAYAAAGADLIFVESPESVEELRTVAARIDVPLVANMVPGGRTPVLTADALTDLGYALALHPGLGYLTAAQALTDAYRTLRETGGVADVGFHDFQSFCEVIGFPEVDRFEARWSEDKREAAE